MVGTKVLLELFPEFGENWILWIASVVEIFLKKNIGKIGSWVVWFQIQKKKKERKKEFYPWAISPKSSSFWVVWGSYWES